ncbi:hypothetical protein [Ottowia sp.]|uniref:hypothetical protein n=1 Tax=Ottowia sp. TaxID=1898956 RepID=UPI003A8442CF
MSSAYVLAAKALAALALVAALVFGARACQERYREQGRVQVRMQWIEADKARGQAEREALIARQRTERQKEQRMAREAEEKTREAAKREDRLRGRIAVLERTGSGLRGTIARLDAASRARRAASTCPAADAEANDAARARGLLAACAERHTAMATDAGQLAHQVMGLQDHVVVVQPEAAALIKQSEVD